MYRLFIYIILFSTASVILGQEMNYKKFSAEFSYISTEHIYLKSSESGLLNPGDTLYILEGSMYNPILAVAFNSSSSAACKSINGFSFSKGDRIDLFYLKEVETDFQQDTTITVASEIEHTQQATADIQIISDKYKTELDGKFSVSSYSNFTDIPNSNYIRWKYSLSLSASNLLNVPLSFETYTNYRYRPGDPRNSNSDLFDKLKIYSLNIGYKFDNFNVTVGRKINPILSNIGAVDGIQFEGVFGRYAAGIAAGTRPDYSNYGFNADLFQTGGYVGRNDTINSGFMRNTISVFQQMNNFKTDRRFMYIQHSNNIITRDLQLFVSSELDLYKREAGVEKNTLILTSLYVSARYSVNKWVNISTSYDARKNVVYYETYKSYADSLLESETRQGLRSSIAIRPMNLLFVRLHYGYRFKNSDIKSSTNYGAVASYSNVPVINSMVSVNYNRLSTSYVDGNIYGLRLTKDFFEGSLNSSLGYRRVDYNFNFGGYNLIQNIVHADASIRIFDRDYISINYEGIFETSNNYGRLYINFTKRF